MENNLPGDYKVQTPPTETKNGYVTIHVTTGQLPRWVSLYLLESSGGRDRTRTCDLLRVKQAL